MVHDDGSIRKLPKETYDLFGEAVETSIRIATSYAIKKVLTGSQAVELANIIGPSGDGQIQAIKWLREMLPISLKDAKEGIEDLFPWSRRTPLPLEDRDR